MSNGDVRDGGKKVLRQAQEGACEDAGHMSMEYAEGLVKHWLREDFTGKDMEEIGLLLRQALWLEARQTRRNAALLAHVFGGK